MRVLLLIVLLSGCTVSLKLDERDGFSKQEIAKAFQERDVALQAMAEKLMALEAEREK